MKQTCEGCQKIRSVATDAARAGMALCRLCWKACQMREMYGRKA